MVDFLSEYPSIFIIFLKYKKSSCFENFPQQPSSSVGISCLKGRQYCNGLAENLAESLLSQFVLSILSLKFTYELISHSIIIQILYRIALYAVITKLIFYCKNGCKNLYEFVFQQVLIINNQTFVKYQSQSSMISNKYLYALYGFQDKLTKLSTYTPFAITASKYGLAIILIILFGNLISLAVQLCMGILVVTVKYLITILILIGETAKQNLILMAVLVMILAITTKLSLNLLIYRSFITLIYQQDICTICLFQNCDYFHPFCGNFFHTQCITQWALQKINKCPLCCQPIQLTKRKEIKKSVSVSMINKLVKERKWYTRFIATGWLILTILYIFNISIMPHDGFFWSWNFGPQPTISNDL